MRDSAPLRAHAQRRREETGLVRKAFRGRELIFLSNPARLAQASARLLQLEQL